MGRGHLRLTGLPPLASRGGDGARVTTAAKCIGQPLDAPIEQRIPEAPCFAVIFTSRLAGEHPDYAEAAARMEVLVREMPGYLGHCSARDDGGLGITVSYWSSLDAVAAFRGNIEHLAAQRAGRERYYSEYDLRVARVERKAHFSAPEDLKAPLH